MVDRKQNDLLSVHPKQKSSSHKGTSSNHVYSASVETVSNTQSSRKGTRSNDNNNPPVDVMIETHTNPSSSQSKLIKKSKLPLSALPSGSQIQAVQLTNIASGHNDDQIVEEKDIFTMPNTQNDQGIHIDSFLRTFAIS